MLGTIIGKLGLPILVNLIGGALSRVDNPVAQSASQALGNFETAMVGGAISAEQMAEANRHAEKLAELKSKEYETAMEEINQSIRAEVASEDVYVRRMRPTFGYLMAITWAVQMLGLAYVFTFKTERAPEVLNSMEALTTIWAVGLSVLGIYVYKRSEEKKGFASLLGSKAAQAPVTKTDNISANTSAAASKLNE